MESTPKWSKFVENEMIQSFEIKKGEEVIYFEINCKKCNNFHSQSMNCYVAAAYRELCTNPNQKTLEKTI